MRRATGFRRWHSYGSILIVLGLWSLTVPATEARGDRIRLRGGGEIHGAVRIDPNRPDVRLVQTINGKKPLEFDAEAILNVVEEDDILDEYDARVSVLPDRAEAHYDFGLWCEENRLTGLAEQHFRRAVELDDDLEDAHRKLGHVLHDGRWMTYDEMRVAQGLVKQGGRWISREEADRREEREADRAELTAWVRQIRALRDAMTSGSPEARAAAEDHLASLRDPTVVPALVQVFAENPDPTHREFLLQLLAAIEGPEARDALIARALRDPEASIRREAVAVLDRRKEPEAVKRLTNTLQHKEPVLVGRAALALAGLRATDAVPRLVDALVRVERRMVWTRTMRPTAAPAPVSALSMNGQSFPVLTGPAMAPGVVAYGATSVPVGSGVGLSMGSGGMSEGPPELRMVTNVQRNPDVLDALRSLTGQDFGYDATTWKRWVARNFRENNHPVRSVPQP